MNVSLYNLIHTSSSKASLRIHYVYAGFHYTMRKTAGVWMVEKEELIFIA